MAYWNAGKHCGRKHIGYNKGQLWRELANHGHELCPLINLPSFNVQQATLGILHTMGLGVTAYVLGNVLWEALDNTGLAHTKKDRRCALLLHKLQAGYKVSHIKYQLQHLTLSTLKPGGKPPKLGANACKSDV